MKKSSKRFVVAIICVLCLLLGLMTFVACNNDQYTITLDAGSGSLYQTTVKVAKDASILSAVGDIKPNAEGLIFDGWLLNGQPVNADDKATQNITLVASYKTSYRVEVYFQNADKTNYVQDESKTVIGYGKVGESVSPSVVEVNGYVLNREISSDATKTLVPGENNLKYFYARADRKITYASLNDDSMDSFDIATYNGAKVTVEDCTFEREGYTFIGWSDSLSLGADTAFAVGNVIEINGDVKLYAQWGVTYDEAFGSGDSVTVAEFVSKDGSLMALLKYSDGTSAVGTYDSLTKFFTVDSKKGQIDDEYGQFLYDVTGLYLGYSLLGNMSDEKYGTLSLDAHTGSAIYTINGETVNGTYEELRLSSGAFSGEKYFSSADEEFYFCFLDSAENEDLDTDTYVGEFFRRGEEEGTYVIVDMSGGEFGVPYDYNIKLDGYGGLSFPIPTFMNIANAYGSYSGYNEETGEWKYVYEGQLFQDTVGEYPREFIFKAGYIKSLAGSYEENPDGSITTDGEILDQIPIVLIYDENIADTYESEDGDLLEMDGYGNAVYTPADGDAIEGYVAFNGLASYVSDFGFTDSENAYEETTSIKAIIFVYYDIDDSEQSIMFLCQDYLRVEKDGWSSDAEIIDIKESHTLYGVDVSKESGCYRKAHGEEDFIEFRLDGSGHAELSLYDVSSKTNIWFASGSYEMTSENEGEFTLEEATQSLAYLGVAAGAFKFRLTWVDGEVSFIIRDETLVGSYGNIEIDGYGKLTDNGVAYTYEKIGNNVLKAQDSYGNVVMYTITYSNGEIVNIKASANDSLVGEYLTVVEDNALYIGPGKLVFDGNGRALFYEMAYGEFIGEGLYTYNRDTNRGTFITSGDMQFYVESFDFCITTMEDSDGILCNVYIKYVEANEMTLVDDEENELYLDGYGFASYNGGALTRYELTEYEYLGTKLSFIDSTDIFYVSFEEGIFVKEEAFGLYLGVYYDVANDAYMIDDYNQLTFYGKYWGEINETYAEYDMYDFVDVEPYGHNGDEFKLSCYYCDYDENDEEILDLIEEVIVKLVKLPAFDDFGEQYYVDVFLVYDESLDEIYDHEDENGCSRIEVDGYGNVVYTDTNGNVFEVEFYNVVITDTMMYIEINDERFTEPSRMLTVQYDANECEFTTSNEVGTYARYFDDDFYYPMINFFGYDEKEGGYMFMIFAPQTVNGETELIPYAIGTYAPVSGQKDVYQLTITGKADEFISVQHIFTKDTFEVKLIYVENENGAYSSYIVLDENAQGEYTFEDTTFTLDGFGAVTIDGSEVGSAKRVGDILILTIDGQTNYYYVGEDNALSVAGYYIYIEFIK